MIKGARALLILPFLLTLAGCVQKNGYRSDNVLGRDPYLPLVKLQEKKIKITGLALFDDDKFVASLNDEEMKIFRLLIEKSKIGTFEVRLNKDEYVSILNQGSQVRYRMTISFRHF
ncbi:Ger(x)C family spore germination C-terminal domain-containing protein [Cohnella luojiensis]|nr:Ger(x)C family spore germination C-terminal domain-containing protein [Cohnella luojiensis]